MKKSVPRSQVLADSLAYAGAPHECRMGGGEGEQGGRFLDRVMGAPA